MSPRPLAALALIVASLVACSGGGYGGGAGLPTAPGDGHTVAATPSLAFTPASLSINSGESVSFDFGGTAHNVFFDTHAGAPANIEGNNSNVSVQRAFATAGTYTYTCHIHPAMHGSVVVR
jgi:plastocyanin